MNRTFLAIAAAICIAFAGTPSARQPKAKPIAVNTAALPLVRASGLVLASRFGVPNVEGRMPDGTVVNEFDYANGSVAFNAVNQSLFVVGHDWGQHVAEMSIPAAGETASMLQGFRDALGGRLAQIDPDNETKKIGGLFVAGSKLLVSGYTYYDGAGNATASHFVRATNLADPQVVGPLRVGDMNPGFYGGYFAAIPGEWQSELGGDLLVGQCCLSIISRTSFGPAAFAVRGGDVIAAPKRVAARPLVYYPQDDQTLGRYGVIGSVNPVFNGTTKVRGATIPAGTASLLFFGSTGTGKYCYGIGTNDPAMDLRKDTHGDMNCYDPSRASKGEHAYPYRSYVWAYDLREMSRTAGKKPWDVTPYATWEFADVPFVTGVADDPATGRVFVSSPSATGFTIYVFKIS